MGCRFDGWFSNDREFVPILPTTHLEGNQQLFVFVAVVDVGFFFKKKMQSKTQSEVSGFSSADAETVFMKSGCTSENTHEAITAFQSGGKLQRQRLRC